MHLAVLEKIKDKLSDIYWNHKYFNNKRYN
jgi:hypothetical protein